MPSLSTRLTGDVLRQAVEDSQQRYFTRGGREIHHSLIVSVAWDLAADNIGALTDCVVDGNAIRAAVQDSAHNYDDAAAALCDAIEARREPSAAPEGEK